MKSWIVSIVFSLLIVLVIRQYFASVYVVSGSSMEPKLFQGDLLLVKPINTLHKQEIYRRTIVLFSEPNSKKVVQVKRVVGLPGDTLTCTDFILKKDITTVKRPYWVKTLKKEEDWLKKGVSSAVAISTANDWLIGLTDEERTRLLELPNIKWAINPPEKTLEQPDFLKKIPNWSLEHFGPLVVPKQGSSLLLTKNNWTLYEEIIALEGKISIDNVVTMIKSNGKYHYMPEQDYYFLLGDHRGISIDSRFYGFIPKKSLKATFITKLFSGISVKMPAVVGEN